MMQEKIAAYCQDDIEGANYKGDRNLKSKLSEPYVMLGWGVSNEEEYYWNEVVASVPDWYEKPSERPWEPVRQDN